MDKDHRYLKEVVAPGVFKPGQEVGAVVYAFTDLGVKVAIDDVYSGLAYKNEIFEDIRIGQELRAFIKCVREDGRIDVSLRPREGEEVSRLAEKILEKLRAADGQLPFNDKTSPEEIKKHFQVSKKIFKKAIGVLFKRRVIRITATGIDLGDERREAAAKRVQKISKDK